MSEHQRFDTIQYKFPRQIFSIRREEFKHHRSRPRFTKVKGILHTRETTRTPQRKTRLLVSKCLKLPLLQCIFMSQKEYRMRKKGKIDYCRQAKAVSISVTDA